MMTSIQKEYKIQIELLQSEKENKMEKQRYLPFIRFIFFFLTLAFFYNYLINRDILFFGLTGIALLVFLVISWLDNLLKSKIEQYDRLIQICNNEIKATKGDFSPFESGDEYIDTDHNYAYDLDLFGKNSLFHCINRSVTIFGKNRLAEYLKNAYELKNEILERQEAVRELSDKKDFRHQLQLVFFGQKSTERDWQEFNTWLALENKLYNSLIFSIIRFALPAITILSIVLSFMSLLVVQVPVMMVIVQLLIVSFYGRKTMSVGQSLSSNIGIISKYARFLLLIEKENFKSGFLCGIKGQLSHHQHETPATIIRQLYSLLNWMDSNLNIIASVILNGLFLFNLQMLTAVEKWKIKYRDVIPRWFAIIGEFDALSSLATFAYNNPEYIFPVPVADDFYFEASNLGHPLILKEECVTNNMIIPGWNRYCIITGANMSGKSTFLRSVGANYVLAMAGAPVFAAKFIFYPVKLHSSIRTSDSLARKESFFYAELKRLKGIITELESGQHTFILLDEILKGTNSKDKQAGSIALLKQLIRYQSVGLIATHDLVLGDLINSYPENIRNLCFEIQIVENEMSIDYKLSEGICQNLNATFLMKKMGILIE
jgi:hypothetical protein